jgi:hypothetical protein
MEKDCSNGKMDHHTKVTMKMIKNMVLENISIKRAKASKGNGDKASAMVRAL